MTPDRRPSKPHGEVFTAVGLLNLLALLLMIALLGFLLVSLASE